MLDDGSIFFCFASVCVSDIGIFLVIYHPCRTRLAEEMLEQDFGLLLPTDGAVQLSIFAQTDLSVSPCLSGFLIFLSRALPDPSPGIPQVQGRKLNKIIESP